MLKLKEFFNSIPPIIKVFFIVDISFCLLYLLNGMIDHPIKKLTHLLDLNGETSFSAWFSSIQFFCVFIFYSIFCFYKIKENKKALLLVCFPLVFLLMSADESVQIHEWIGTKSDMFFESGTREGTAFHNTGIWVFLVGIPFFTGFIWFCFVTKKYINKPSSLKKLILGMIVMLSGALGFELLSNFINHAYLPIEIAFEEGFEMMGVTIMLWAAYELAIDFFPELGEYAKKVSV